MKVAWKCAAVLDHGVPSVMTLGAVVMLGSCADSSDMAMQV